MCKMQPGLSALAIYMLPTEIMREELRHHLISRGKQVSMKTIISEKAYYKKLVVRKTPKSFLNWDEKC